MILNVETILQAVTVLVTAGAAFGGVKVALNGTRERVKRIDIKLDKHIESDEGVQMRLLTGMTRIETKVDERTGPH